MTVIDLFNIVIFSILSKPGEGWRHVYVFISSMYMTVLVLVDEF